SLAPVNIEFNASQIGRVVVDCDSETSCFEGVRYQDVGHRMTAPVKVPQHETDGGLAGSSSAHVAFVTSTALWPPAALKHGEPYDRLDRSYSASRCCNGHRRRDRSRP